MLETTEPKLKGTNESEWKEYIYGLTLLSLSLADLRRETGLDSRDTASATARIACDKVQTIFSFVQVGIWTTTRLTCNVFNDVSTQYILDLFLLESTFDD